MKCEDFKNRMTILWDKPNHTEEKEELMRHIAECDECRAEYESFERTIELLTPHHTPQMKKEIGEKGKTAIQPAWSKKIMRIAAAIAIFIAGVATGLTNLLSVDAHASKSSELVKQALMSMRCAGNFIMELKVRTLPSEPFAYFNPEDSMINVRVMSMQINEESIWRIEKEEGRTLVCDGNRKYMWADDYKMVGNINDNMEENFSALLETDKYDAKENRFFGTDKHDDIEISETDSTTVVTVISKRPGNGLVSLYNNDKSGKRDRYTTESTFTKHDGLLRKIRIWTEHNGVKTLILESRSIVYNVAMNPNRILQLPDAESEDWLSDEQLRSSRIDKPLHKETATEAAKRILLTLTENKPETAKEALFYYSQELDKLTEAMKGCKATNFSKPKQTKDYNGVYVFYELTSPEGEKQKRHVALKFDPELKIWILDGGF
ncbi:MAG: zf-HC2 domain-containing protein [Prevotellaceae bacterium]|nr:zf-HC2 domain-containing protein [Prevotellaceae bacterium]